VLPEEEYLVILKEVFIEKKLKFNVNIDQKDKCCKRVRHTLFFN
jgi:hypothetical protein